MLSCSILEDTALSQATVHVRQHELAKRFQNKNMWFSNCRHSMFGLGHRPMNKQCWPQWPDSDGNSQRPSTEGWEDVNMQAGCFQHQSVTPRVGRHWESKWVFKSCQQDKSIKPIVLIWGRWCFWTKSGHRISPIWFLMFPFLRGRAAERAWSHTC